MANSQQDRARRLKGRVAIVTGAGRGIGKAIAQLLAEHGAAVVIAEKSARVGRSVAARMIAGGHEALFVRTDVTREASVAAMVRRTVKSFGRVDILVNNAGIMKLAPILDTSLANCRDVLTVNLLGPYLCCRAVLPHMIRQKSRAHIVNIASSLGKAGMADVGPYCASKAGLIRLTECLAQEMSKKDIRVHSICPGLVRTRMARPFLQEQPSTPILEPEDVARAVLDLVLGRQKADNDRTVDVHPARRARWRRTRAHNPEAVT